MASTFDEYVAARSGALLRFATALTGEIHAAQDLVQSALIKTHRHWAKVHDAEQPDAYVRRIVLNTHISQGRRRRVVEVLCAVLPTRADPAPETQDFPALDEALNRLPPRQRAALMLRHYEDPDGMGDRS